MPRIPTPLTWKRRNFAVFEPLGMIDWLYAVAVSGLVSGPFAIYGFSGQQVFQAQRSRAASRTPPHRSTSPWVRAGVAG